MLFTERIQGNELLGQMFSTTEAFGNKHDLTYQLCVGHHHGTRSDPGDKTMSVRHRVRHRVKNAVESHLKRAFRFSGSSVLPA